MAYVRFVVMIVQSLQMGWLMSRIEDRQKFVELAQKRVNRTIKDIRLIGNLSNRSNYDYTDDDVKKIHSALKSALDEMKKRFEAKGAATEDLFKL